MNDECVRRNCEKKYVFVEGGEKVCEDHTKFAHRRREFLREA